MPRRTLKLTIAYDGTAYAGWQRQANGPSIQAVLEDEIAAIVGGRHPLIAAGRTDAGVHAAGQVASVTIDHDITCDDLLRALNARIKDGAIRVRAVEEMFDGFDARTHAKSKSYRYAIWTGSPPSPFLRHVVWHVVHRLDVDRMAAAARVLVGEHDFVAFQGRGRAVKTTVRRILAEHVAKVHDVGRLESGAPYQEGRLIRVEITGTGFLRHMVRTITGTLVDIGRGQMAVEEMEEIIRSRERRRTGQTAPPQGLTLWKVQY